jgi:hypothetical protein
MMMPNSCPAAPATVHPPVFSVGAAGTPWCILGLRPETCSSFLWFDRLPGRWIARTKPAVSGTATGGAIRRFHHRAVLPPRWLGRCTCRHILSKGIFNIWLYTPCWFSCHCDGFYTHCFFSAFVNKSISECLDFGCLDNCDFLCTRLM